MLVSPAPLPPKQMLERDTHSPSPNSALAGRPRTVKTQSMTILPSQQQQHSPQASPVGRRSPVPMPRQRGLPTPPNPPPLPDSSPELSSSPPRGNGGGYGPGSSPHSFTSGGSSPHSSFASPPPANPRPRLAHNPFLHTYHANATLNSLAMTDELLADIERADLEQAHSLNMLNSLYPVGYNSDGRSPGTSTYSPSYSPSSSPPHRPSSSSTYPIASAPARASPHSPSVNTRSPDKTLPLQEEPDDEDHSSRTSAATTAKSSPVPPQPTSGRSSRAETLYSEDNSDSQAENGNGNDNNAAGDDSQNEGSGTPKSPLNALPSARAGERINRHRHSRSRASMADSMGFGGIDSSLSHHQQHQQRPPSTQYYEEMLAAPRPSNIGRFLHPEDLRNFMEHPTSSYLSSYLSTPGPDGSLAPTPLSQTSFASPSPRPSFSPIGSPYPYPYTDPRRVALQQQHAHHLQQQQQQQHQQQAQQQQQQHSPRPVSTLDANHPSRIAEDLRRQFQIYAQNNMTYVQNANGYISESDFGPSPAPHENGPFAAWAGAHTRHVYPGGAPYGGLGMNRTASVMSSPSHEPISLPLPGPVGLKKRDGKIDLRRAHTTGGSVGVQTRLAGRKPPPRVESTVPADTSPEATDDESTMGGETTASEDTPRFALGPGIGLKDADDVDDEADWIDEEDEDDDNEDLLGLEYHPSFVSNINKRRRRWDTKWDALAQAFQALDRETDATLILAAAPSHSTKLHMMTSRSIRRTPHLSHSPAIKSLRGNFRDIAVERRKLRAHASLQDRLLLAGSGSSASSSVREDDLQRALSTALGTLHAFGGIFDEREARWAEEMRKVSEDRERIELLLKQAVGERTQTKKGDERTQTKKGDESDADTKVDD